MKRRLVKGLVMSVKVMSLVWDHAPYSEGTLLVLLALADWANDDGHCWPKIPQLVEKSRQSRRNVLYVISRLESDGFLTRMAGRGKGHHNEYQIDLDALKGAKGAKVAPFEKVQKVQKVQVAHVKGASSDISHNNDARADPSVDPSVELKETTTRKMSKNFREPDPDADQGFMLDVLRQSVEDMPDAAKRSAKLFHYTLHAKLKELGWQLTNECTIAADGSNLGRIDLVVTYPAPCAIELDRVSPREKSLLKLRAFTGTRAIILRESPVWPDAISGIDAVICAGARTRPMPSHLVPDDFPREPIPKMLEYAKTNAPHVDVKNFHQWFLNYEFRKPGTAWDRRWNLCLLKAEAEGLHPPHESPAPARNGCAGYPRRGEPPRNCGACGYSHFAPSP